MNAAAAFPVEGNLMRTPHVSLRAHASGVGNLFVSLIGGFTTGAALAFLLWHLV
jgi:hypothetical protein